MCKGFISFILFLLTTHCWATEKLIFALDVIRHGDRTPIFLIPAQVAFHQQELPGQLTPLGMQQEYQLGARLRKKYIEETHLLPAQYNAAMMYVRSTDVDRTLMSAEAFLLGLYPLSTGPHLNATQFALPQGYQPIPIHTVAEENDLLAAPNKTLSLVGQLSRWYVVNRYVFSQPEWQQKNDQLKSKFAKWSKATGVQLTHLSQLASLGNSLYIDQLHHIPLPSGLSSTDSQEIIENGQWVTTTLFKPKEVGRHGFPLLRFIFNHLEAAEQQHIPLRYVLLSAHDSTLLLLMSALGVPLQEMPPYASDLNFALYESGSHHCLIRVTYNGKSVNIPACHGSACTLTQLKSMITS